MANVRAQYPQVTIAGHYSPPFRPLLEMDQEEITQRIRAARPDLLFVSFGCPKAEKWIALHYRSLGVPVTIGVGATIDFLAGRVKRAPVWMQRSGLEWTYRLLQEPRRLLRRYATDLWVFGWALAAQWVRLEAAGSLLSWWKVARGRLLIDGRVANQPATALSVVLSEPTWQRIQPPHCLNARAIHRDAALWEKIAAGERHCLLETAEVQFIDSTGVGLLLRLHKRLRAAGNFLVLLDPGLPLQRALKLLRLKGFFLTAFDAVEARALIAERTQAQQSPVLTNGPLSPVVWQGEITATVAAKVWELTRGEIKSRSSWRKQWLIDVSGVTFMDSAGAALMRRLQQYAPRKGARVHFTGVSVNVRDVLRRCGLEAALLGPAAPVSLASSFWSSAFSTLVSRTRTRTRTNPPVHFGNLKLKFPFL